MTPGLEYNPEAARRRVFLAELEDERSQRNFDKWAADPEKGRQFRSLMAGGRAASAHPNFSGPVRPMSVLPAWTCLETLVDLDTGTTAPVLDADVYARRAAEQERFAEAEKEYHAHAAAETGVGCDPTKWAQQQMDRAEIRAQSHELARRLESVGKNAYRNEALSLWTYWVHSKRWESIPNFRRICLLPYVAAMVRAPKLAALEFYLERNPFCRFWTFTSGRRVGIDGIRERVQYLHRGLSRLNSWLRNEWGVEIVFRSTEFGTLEIDEYANRVRDSGGIEFDENGEPLFHVHSHCVICSLRGYLPPNRWSRMIDAIHAQWPHHWDAGKAIKNPRECCKYVTKPGDMLRLTPEQLGRLHEAVFRLKLVQPMGALAEEIRRRKSPEVGKTLRRYPTPEGSVWREVFDQNRHLEQDEADRWAAGELAQAERVQNVDTLLERPPAKPGERVALPEKRTEDFCRVFARMSPAFGPRGIKEPRVMVGGTIRDERAVLTHPLVEKLWAETVESWEDAMRKSRALLSVHTVTPTVSDQTPLPILADIPERVRPPAEPVFDPLPA